MTDLTPDQFRADFPEFSDVTKYSDTVVQSRINLSVSFVNPDRWGDQVTYGMELVVAHFLTISAANQRASNAGLPAGQLTGQVTSKSVDKVSVGYAASTATIADAGSWNLSTYGIEWLTLARIYGSGGIQL